MKIKKIILFTSLYLGITSAFAEKIECDNNTTRDAVLTKIGYAPTNKSFEEISKYCKWQTWVLNQLNNPNLYNDDHIENDFANFEINTKNDLQMMQKYWVEAPPTETFVQNEMFTRRLNYALYSENRLREMMVWFWFNHFNVYGDSGSIRYMKSYEEIFRNNPFGNFKEILLQASTHPSMLIYLDNELNNKKMKLEGKYIGPNDNQARELFELHSMGVDGGYTEKDIQELAKILTGFKSLQQHEVFLSADFTKYQKELYSLKDIKELRVFFAKYKEFNVTKVNDNFSLYYDIGHEEGDKIILGETVKYNKDQEIKNAIEIIVNHPSTAKFISKKIYTYFLGTDYNQSVLEEMEKSFKKTNGEIKPILEILFTSKEFENNLIQKKYFKNPFEFMVSTTKLTINNQKINDNTDIRNILFNLGFGIHWKLTPEGYSLDPVKYESSNTLHQYINFADFVVSDKAFGGHQMGKFNYYQMNKQNYFKFLISPNWINR